MKVITYARGSNNSVEEQQERILKALPPEYEVVGSYVDVASGLNPHQPGLDAAWKRLASGEIQALCIHSLDRLTRRINKLVMILHSCNENGFVIQVIPGANKRRP